MPRATAGCPAERGYWSDAGTLHASFDRGHWLQIPRERSGGATGLAMATNIRSPPKPGTCSVVLRTVTRSLPIASRKTGISRVRITTLQGTSISRHCNSVGVPQTADFYLCGPAGFLADLTAALKSWGVPDSCIHSEAFGAGPSITPGIASSTTRTPHPPAGEVGTGPSVSFTRSGLTVPWDSRFASLLEFAEACDVPVRWSCRAGVCHTCESGLIDGKINYAPEPLDRPAEGNVLICCSTPLSKIELDL